MKIIQLPSILPGELDLAAINKKLHSKEVQLDWSAVTYVSKKDLAVLCAGLDLSNDADVLGLEEDGAIAEQIINEIFEFFEHSHQENSTEIPLSNEDITPEVWTPEESLATETPINNEEFPDQSPLTPLSKGGIASEKSLSKEIPPNPQGGDQVSGESQLLPNQPSAYELRSRFEEMIVKELLGPAQGEEEEVEDRSLRDRYLVGVLAPQNSQQKSEQQEELAVAQADNPEEGNTETQTTGTPTMFPSSLGMTFTVSGEASAIAVTAKWGRYEREASQYADDQGERKNVWKRFPMEGTEVFPLKAGETDRWVVNRQETPDVYVEIKVRQQGGDWLITLFLVNNQTEPKQLRDRAWLFQPQLEVRSHNPDFPDIFIRKPLPRATDNLDPLVKQENDRMAMLYRQQVEFAVGHNVGVHAEISPETPQRAIALSTQVAPTYEVPKTTPPDATEIPELTGLVLDMGILADSDRETLLKQLQPLPDAYESWIEQQAQRIHDPTENLENYAETAQSAIAQCETTLDRIRQGIDLLANNDEALAAFQFMNAAMRQQRVRGIYAEQRRRGHEVQLNEVDVPKNRSWYSFQLAFILLNLPSQTDLHHRDRSHPTEAICDLLWFPTGGGKTEAYLGLTAYTIALRRKQGMIGGRDGEHGVAVLMRYTLRLLTLQQFQRATTLICACESLRRQDPETWGNEPIRIGLWVGYNSTPNYTSQSEEYSKQKKGQYQQHRGGSPHQLNNCPWCGTAIDPAKHLIVDPVDKGEGRTYIKCGDNLGGCEFSKGEGLPILVVDEEIYRRLPALLIATVDKFAQMPWKGEIQMLFGQVNGYCQRHGYRSPNLEDSDRHPKKGKLPAAKTLTDIPQLRPPDLIIQDELHLISGPLGTLVGLYETAVDQLASWEVNGKKVRPKVIASTATIKQAQTQVHHLFLRNVQVFPPQGLDISDNFFSRQRKPSEATPGRRYLGICSPGRRMKATLIRVYVAALSASQQLYNLYGNAIDPWMTLVGYFNSLRELGGTRRLVEDDIRSRLSRQELVKRGLATRSGLSLEELTSRKTSTEIPQLLDWLEIPFHPEQEAKNKALRKQGKKVEQKDPLDVILATNMISVGVDVKRLGLMVACGQPKNTAEYIQATSRVGRSFPGLVITVYNWTRPRDLSHYERFEHYHGTFYQNVEALSVTPFAPGALSRGLTALLVSLVRLSGQEFNLNDHAGKIARSHPYIQAAIDAIVERASAIGNTQIGEQVRDELNETLDQWLDQAENRPGGGSLVYQSQKAGGTSIPLLQSPEEKSGQWETFTCLNSLRNVEPTVNLILNDQPPDEDFDRVPEPYTVSSDQ